MSRVGVLALQGDVPEHERALAQLLPPPEIRAVRAPSDLDEVDALLLPGGESTTISRLLADSGLQGPLLARGRAGLPMLATCAGLILIARELEASPAGRDPTLLGLLHVKVRRNDYGRQRESFEAPVRVEGLEGTPFPGVFIRSPRILSVASEATPFAFRGTDVVGVRQGPVWGLTFHPELSEDPRVLRMFLEAAGILPANGAQPAGRKEPARSRR